MSFCVWLLSKKLGAYRPLISYLEPFEYGLWVADNRCSNFKHTGLLLKNRADLKNERYTVDSSYYSTSTNAFFGRLNLYVLQHNPQEIWLIPQCGIWYPGERDPKGGPRRIYSDACLCTRYNMLTCIFHTRWLAHVHVCLCACMRTCLHAFVQYNVWVGEAEGIRRRGEGVSRRWETREKNFANLLL
jgi:hypothetical protein